MKSRLDVSAILNRDLEKRLERDEQRAPPDEVVAGLALLLRSPPLWPVPQWRIAVERVEAFAFAHDCEARAAGWSDLQLYGLHKHGPYQRLDGMGAAFLIAMRGDRVVAVRPDVIHLASVRGARLRLFRDEPHPDSMIAWELCRA
jgi:hypothetical protein